MSDVNLPRPPRVPPLGGPPPIIEPMLVDLPPWEGHEVDRLEPLDVDISEGLRTAELLGEAREVALRDDRVRELLADQRHVVVGVSTLEEKGEREPRFVLVGYSYDEARAFEVLLSRSGDRFEVVDVSLADYHPPPADEEIAEAIELARADDRVSVALERGFEAQALLVSDVEAGDEHHGSRRFSVVFGPPEERLPRVHVIVDLVSREVVQAKMGAAR